MRVTGSEEGECELDECEGGICASCFASYLGPSHSDISNGYFP